MATKKSPPDSKPAKTLGRPSKYTPEVVNKICQFLQAGNTRRASCLCAGISEDTFANWMNSFTDFSDSVKKAEAEAEARNVAIINLASKENWQASAWWLERRRREDFSRSEKIDLTTSSKDVNKMTTQELEEELAKLRQHSSEEN